MKQLAALFAPNKMTTIVKVVQISSFSKFFLQKKPQKMSDDHKILVCDGTQSLRSAGANSRLFGALNTERKNI